ncbi:N-acetyltransferase [Spirulina sp. CCNP1310]|uniref:GNAT family N-acetyltransferase n=1 Tax=Spirulina sp. CCNP1310 TaxID=3110249 RepID=UPI002B2128BA|nr:N-acetyltransferase [Spirulina sp. CCNP1310]MEA5420836.1 N-acetyltransferase [Spirulina sp. CCNP1310]
MIHIRTASPKDQEQIRAIHRDAFGEEGITVSELALALIADPTAQPILSLIAEVKEQAVGHILFTGVNIGNSEPVAASILAPLGVVTHFQRQGIGRTLVEQGLSTLRQQGCQLVFVLGNPNYYGRYEFNADHGVLPPYPLPYPEAWMAIALQGPSRQTFRGELVCAQSLRDPKHW